MEVAEKLLTAAEFLQAPKPASGERLELVKGEVIAMSPPGAVHGNIAGILASRLLPFAGKHRLGKVLVETGYHLESHPDTVRAPDVSYVSLERLPGGELPEGFIPGAPDLEVEIVSPGDLDWEVQGKVRAYLAGGARRVWVVRPHAGAVTVHHPDGSARTLSAEAALTSDDASFPVPGFSLPLLELFE